MPNKHNPKPHANSRPATRHASGGEARKMESKSVGSSQGKSHKSSGHKGNE